MSTLVTAERLVAQFNFLSMKAKEIAQTLLVRAVDQGREDEMVKKIGARLESAHDMPESHAEGLKLAQVFDERCGTSQALRKSSLKTGVLLEDTTLRNPPLEQVSLASMPCGPTVH